MDQDHSNWRAGTNPDRAEDSLWSAVPDAIRGSHEDYTSIPLTRAIVLLAIPMMLELVMESTFGLVDIYFVGRLGSAAVATVGLTGSLVILVFAIVMGLSMGTTATVARRIGEGDPEAAGLAAWQAILAGVTCAIPISVCGALLAPKLLGWMGGTDAIIAGSSYAAMLFAGATTIFLLFLNNAIFRAAGDAAVAMRALWLANPFSKARHIITSSAHRRKLTALRILTPFVAAPGFGMFLPPRTIRQTCPAERPCLFPAHRCAPPCGWWTAGGQSQCAWRRGC